MISQRCEEPREQRATAVGHIEPYFEVPRRSADEIIVVDIRIASPGVSRAVELNYVARMSLPNYLLPLALVAAFSACAEITRVEPAHAASAIEEPTSAQTAQAPPGAAVRPVTDVYFGTSIVDPYRWMESGSAEVDAWMHGQAEYTQRALQALPLQQALSARVRALNALQTDVQSAQRRGSRMFYLRRKAGDEAFKLFVREGSSPERLLVDPTTGDAGLDGDKHSIDYFEPSPDGSLVAYGVSANGSELAVLHVVNVAAAQVLPDSIDRARWAFPAWQPDGTSFFYKRDRELANDAAESERFTKPTVYLHDIGADPEADVAIFGHDVSSNIEVPPAGFPYVYAPAQSRFLFAEVSEGVQHELTLYWVRRDQVSGARTPWHKLVQPDDQITGYDVYGDTIYLKSHRGAPRFKVLKLQLGDAAHVDLDQAQEVVPESQGVVRGIYAAQDALYIRTLDAGIGRLLRLPHSAARPSELALDTEGTITEVSSSPAQPGVLFQLTSWTRSPRLMQYDLAQGSCSDTGVIPPSSADFAHVIAREVKVRAPDGTRVPLSIVRRSDLTGDGTQPTLLRAYGAYGTTAEPRFDPMLLAWLERGGVFAVCHPRGGGEFGDSWHAAGKLEHKPNTIVDVLACADYLVDQHVTRPAQLAIEGTSAGGIPAGNAIVQRPELFGAAVIRVGMTNALRFERIPIGPMNTVEFGTVETEAGFRMLRAIDAYHKVQDQSAYPAVLLTTGAADPRVSPWQAAKFAARLQAATSSHKPVLLRVDYGAGHGWGSAQSLVAAERADEYAFLFSQLALRDERRTP